MLEHLHSRGIAHRDLKVKFINNFAAGEFDDHK